VVEVGLMVQSPFSNVRFTCGKPDEQSCVDVRDRLRRPHCRAPSNIAIRRLPATPTGLTVPPSGQ
jgi:hypothetical protein